MWRAYVLPGKECTVLFRKPIAPWIRFSLGWIPILLIAGAFLAQLVQGQCPTH